VELYAVDILEKPEVGVLMGFATSVEIEVLEVTILVKLLTSGIGLLTPLGLLVVARTEIASSSNTEGSPNSKGFAVMTK
jgi:hypothetical protein